MHILQLRWRAPILSGSGTDQDPYVYGETFNVDLDAVQEWLAVNAGEHYTGTSGGEFFYINFSQDPGSDVINSIISYWNGIDVGDAEALSHVSQQEISDAIEAAKIDSLSKTYDQLSTAQKKLLMGLTPTRAELGL